MLTSVLLDFNCPLTLCTSSWATMGGDMKVLNWIQGPSLAGHHVQGGATALHALAVTRMASSTNSANDRPTDQSSA